MEAGQELYNGKVVGVTFEPTKSTFKACLAHFKDMTEQEANPEIQLEADPQNPHDPLAIKVLMGQGEKFFHIGYIPRTHNKQILDIGLHRVDASLLKCNIFEDKVVGFGIEVKCKNDPKLF